MELAKRITSYALGYAKVGWKVLPLHSVSNEHCSCGRPDCNSQGKHPRIRDWRNQATNQERQVFDWWQQWPGANIGLATGHASGFVVLDIDPRHGGDQSLMELQREFGDLPQTVVAKTGGGGLHYYFAAPAGELSNKANIRPGIDFRGDGGYIVAPPGQHVSGGSYSWDGNPNERQLAPVPHWLMELLSERPKVVPIPQLGATIPEGGRNDYLARKAGALRRANLSPVEMEAALHAANLENCKPPVSEFEVKEVVRSISRYANSEEQKIKWPEVPKPVPDARPEIPKLDESMLPKLFRPWILDISERMHVVPEQVFAPAMVAVAAVAGRKIGIYPKQKDNKWFEVPNLWGAIVGRPGIMKSPVIAEAMSPLEELIKSANEDYESGRAEHEAREQTLQMEIEAKKDDLKKAFKSDKGDIEGLEAELAELQGELLEGKVTAKRYRTNDATIEKMGHLLRDNPNGILLFRDELAGWMRTLDKAGREGDREFYLEAWNGYGSYSVDRVGSGTTHIPALCLSVFGGIQPSKLNAQLKRSDGGKEDDGLLQRFQMLVCCEPRPEWKDVDQPPKEAAYERVADFFTWLDQLDGKALGEVGKKGIPGVRFCQEALEEFRAWRYTLEQRIASDDSENPGFESHLSKYRSFVPKLALMFWLMEVSQDKNAGEVSLSATKLAIRWANFLEAHAKRIYFSIGTDDQANVRVLHRKLLKGDIVDGTSVRSIYRCQWKGLQTKEEVESAIEHLEELGWLRSIRSHGPGKPSYILKLHPTLIKAQTSEAYHESK